MILIAVYLKNDVIILILRPQKGEAVYNNNNRVLSYDIYIL